MSYNAWLYVEANPINHTDPSGRFPDWCKSARSAIQYSDCVLDYYGLEAVGDFSGASQVAGTPGCYSGPVAYRAVGYAEGEGVWGLIVNISQEVVYDFATMERHGFIATTIGLNDSVIGGGYVNYAEEIHGLRSDSTLVNDYSGWSSAVQIGASIDTYFQPIGFGAGVSKVQSMTDPKIESISVYLGLGISLDLIPILELGVGAVYASPYGGSGRYAPKSYVLPSGKVNQNSLLTDLRSGSTPASIPVFREWGVALAMRYMRIYDEIHTESY